MNDCSTEFWLNDSLNHKNYNSAQNQRVGTPFAWLTANIYAKDANMSFRINTNIAALTSHAVGVQNNRDLSSSLEKLSSGLRINKAADDSSGMAIADSLRSQSANLGQAIRNANDAIGMVQTADKAMDEQIKILDTIKTKAVQAAQDGQTLESRRALQSDIQRLLEELDNIANTTSFNGQQMLSGSFSNKKLARILTPRLRRLLAQRAQIRLGMCAWKLLLLAVQACSLARRRKTWLKWDWISNKSMAWMIIRLKPCVFLQALAQGLER